jgi:flagellar protein FliS
VIIQKLFDASIRFLAEAEEEIERGESPEESLTRVRKVIGGLMTALNFDAGEMAENLLRLYLFVLDRIQGVDAGSPVGGLREARRVLDTLRGAWEEMPPEESSPLATGRPHGLSFRG